jgi:hypothetical protein
MQYQEHHQDAVV